MNKLRTFAYIFRRTFTSLDYYHEILQSPLKFSFKFFFTYFFFYSLILTLFITGNVLWSFQSFFTKVLPHELAAAWPAELEIAIQDGAASVNVEEPYYIPLSNFRKLREEFDSRIQGASTDRIYSLLAIDTKAKIEDFPQYQTIALLTRSHLSIKDEEGNLRSIPLAEVPNTLITKAEVERLISLTRPYLPYIVPLAILGLFLGLLLSLPAWKLIYNFWLATILWILGRVLNFPLKYWKAYQLGLHFIAISTTFFGIWQLLGWSFDFPWLQTILLTLLGILVVRHLQTYHSSR